MAHLRRFWERRAFPVHITVLAILLFITIALGQDDKHQIPNVRAGKADDVAFLSRLGDETESADKEERGILNYKPLFRAIQNAWPGRSDEEPMVLRNNHPFRGFVDAGTSHEFIFPVEELRVPRDMLWPVVPPTLDEGNEVERSNLELRKRSVGPYRIHLTLSICGLPDTHENVAQAPPGLVMFISENKSDPDSDSTGPATHEVDTIEGLAYHETEISEDLRLEIHAPDLDGYNGGYTYEVTASMDHPYTLYHDFESLRHVDSDHGAGLFETTDLTNPWPRRDTAVEAWMKTASPFTLFVYDKHDTKATNLRRSYCGLAENAKFQTTQSGFETGMVAREGFTVKQQFYVPGLNQGASYHASLGLPSNFSKRGAGTPTGGGIVWRAVEFQTNEGDACQVLHNLSFCDKVNYAAPAPANGSVSVEQLSKVYDDFAAAAYQNFSNSLAQVACETAPDSLYSLATNCGACDAAYRAWVCAVTIPRCADQSANSSGFIPRNASNITQPLVNSQIQPGPFLELPPCGNLCFGLVQNCPSILGFACPYTNTWYYNQTYGYQGPNFQELTCNPYGDPKVWGINIGSSLHPSIPSILAITLSLSLIFSTGVL